MFAAGGRSSPTMQKAQDGRAAGNALRPGPDDRPAGREADAHRGPDGQRARLPLRIPEDRQELAGNGHQHLRGHRRAAVGPRDPEGLRPPHSPGRHIREAQEAPVAHHGRGGWQPFFATHAETLANGLLDQLAMFHEEHPDLRLVIIDTLQMVRSSARDYSYSSDYRELAELKRFTDLHGITILLIHHTRKMGDSDVMNTVSGTNAITGAADFTWVLAKPSRNSQDGTLSITGCDVEQREIYLQFKDHRWNLVKDVPAEELAAASVPRCIGEVVGFMRHNGTWEGRTGDLMLEAGIQGVSPAVFGKYLAQHSMFLEKSGVRYSKRHTSSGSLVKLEHIGDDDGYDGYDGYDGNP